MPLLEYVVLALLGTAGSAVPGGTPASSALSTLGADVVVQPAGGAAVSEFEAELAGQAVGGTSGRAHKGKVHSKTRHSKSRHHRRHTHKGGKYERGTSRNSSTKQ